MIWMISDIVDEQEEYIGELSLLDCNAAGPPLFPPHEVDVARSIDDYQFQRSEQKQETKVIYTWNALFIPLCTEGWKVNHKKQKNGKGGWRKEKFNRGTITATAHSLLEDDKLVFCTWPSNEVTKLNHTHLGIDLPGHQSCRTTIRLCCRSVE